MKKYIKPASLLSLFLFLVSCEETVQLDLDQTIPKVVIEGLLTDRPGQQFVKVTMSADFYNNGATPRVTDAVVSVSDNQGNVYPYIHNPNAHEDSAGYYLPETPFVGVAGRTYTLQVEVSGQTYEAEDQLFAVIPIDELDYQVNEDEEEDPNEDGKIYEILLYATEPQDEKNYYLFKFYRNDSLIYYNETDIYYTDDELLGENIDGVPSPVYYGIGDVGRVEMYSLTRRGYIFFNDLFSLLNNDSGGMFGPIPSTPRTNLSNGALGFFQVGAVTATEITIE